MSLFDEIKAGLEEAIAWKETGELHPDARVYVYPAKAPTKAAPRARLVWRSRDRFRTSRQAWADIAAATGLTAREVRPEHTDARWQWRVGA